MLQKPRWSCAWESRIFWKKKNFFTSKIGKICQKWARNRVFWIYWRNLFNLLIFTEFVLRWKFLLFAFFLHKSHICKKLCSWDMGQNTLSQSDCSIVKSAVSLEQINEIPWLCACWYKFTKIERWSKSFLEGTVTNGCGQSCNRTQKPTYLKNELME